MAIRRFELVEGSSSKFWQVEVAEASLTVTYGRIGTAGTAKTTACADAKEAASEAEKLIKEKTKKGYQEQGANVEKNWQPPARIDHERHVERFLNYKVTGFVGDGEETDGDDEGPKSFSKLRELDKRAFRIGLSYDDDADLFAARLDRLLADPKVGELRALVIGQWWSDVCEGGPDVLVEKLLKYAPKLTSLKGIFIGDAVQEEVEISWIHQSDLGPLLNALPALETVVVRGADGLRFSKLLAPHLKHLTVQCGGLPKAAIADLSNAKLPELTELTLWLGVDEYGGNYEVADLATILSGQNLPKLEHLGLMNSKAEDEIAAAVAKSAILKQLKGLDLSMGTLGDKGAAALLASDGVKKLKHLNLRHNYMKRGTAKLLRALGIPDVHTDGREGVDDDEEAEDEEDAREHRYVEVAE